MECYSTHSSIIIMQWIYDLRLKERTSSSPRIVNGALLKDALEEKARCTPNSSYMCMHIYF